MRRGLSMAGKSRPAMSSGARKVELLGKRLAVPICQPTTPSTKTPGMLMHSDRANNEAIFPPDDHGAAEFLTARAKKAPGGDHLALEGYVAELVAGVPAQVEMDWKGLVPEPFGCRQSPVTRSSLVRAFSLPPSSRGSTKVPSPMRYLARRAAGTLRNRWLIALRCTLSSASPFSEPGSNGRRQRA